MATINDIVLIHLEDAPVSFARVESILPDHKKDWYQIKLLMLQIPLQTVTWILKDAYINGDDFFMNGKKMRLEKVESPRDEGPMPLKTKEKESRTESRDPDADTSDKGEIISFSELRKNKSPEPDNEPEPDIG